MVKKMDQNNLSCSSLHTLLEVGVPPEHSPRHFRYLPGYETWWQGCDGALGPEEDVWHEKTCVCVCTCARSCMQYLVTWAQRVHCTADTPTQGFSLLLNTRGTITSLQTPTKEKKHTYLMIYDHSHSSRTHSFILMKWGQPNRQRLSVKKDLGTTPPRTEDHPVIKLKLTFAAYDAVGEDKSESGSSFVNHCLGKTKGHLITIKPT